MTDEKNNLVTHIEAVKNVYLKSHDSYNRVKICESCDKYIKMAKICGECKCFIPAKSRLRFAACPLDKWEKLELNA